MIQWHLNVRILANFDTSRQLLAMSVIEKVENGMQEWSMIYTKT